MVSPRYLRVSDGSRTRTQGSWTERVGGIFFFTKKNVLLTQ